MEGKQNLREMSITRVFDAPRETVFRAWTDPKIVAKWWGPRGVTNPICEIDPRPGGSIHIVMEAGKELGSFEGQRWPMKGTFKRVVSPELIEYVSSALDDKRGILLEQLVTIKLEVAQGGKTKMSLNIAVTKANKGSEFALSGMEMGFKQMIEKLGEELERR